MNVGIILNNFRSDKLYSKLSQILNSNDTREKLFVIQILRELKCDRAIDLLASLLTDADIEVRREAVFSLSLNWASSEIKNQKNERYLKIVDLMFEILSDKKAGYWAAEYLRNLDDEKIIQRVADKLELALASNTYERLNFAIIIAERYPNLSKKIIFETLSKYRPGLHETLHYAIGLLGLENIFPEILPYLKSNNKRLRFTALEGVERATWGNLNEQLPISREDCEELMTIWENSTDYFDRLRIIELLSKHCSIIAKDLFLEKVCDKDYPFREQLLEPLSGLPLVKADIPVGFVDWLVTKLNYKRHGAFTEQSPASRILGAICDENTVNKKLIPLLNNKDDKIKSDAFQAILQVEKTLGKRLINK